MLLFEQDYRWTPADAQTDVPFAFTVPTGVTELRVQFCFAPGKEESEELCRPQVEKALIRYYDCFPRTLQPMEAGRFLPVKNLITVSLDREGVCLGNAHRWATEQEHILRKDFAAPGFHPPADLPGSWTGMLHLHEVISPVCTGRLRIEGRESA